MKRTPRTPSTTRTPSRSPHVASLSLDGGPLTTRDVVSVARLGRPVAIGSRALKLMSASRRIIDRSLTDGLPHYGINTGFGSLSQKRISRANLETLQRNLVRSHAAGVGEPLPDETVRAMMLLLCASLSRGFSGVRPLVAQALADLIDGGITPIVPSIGSVGASGDLAPLAHVALALMGEGDVTFNGYRCGAAEALRISGLNPVELSAKEGLALINGTHLMAAQGALLVEDAKRLMNAATLALAMSMDACRATDAFLDPRLYEARNHAHAGKIAARLRELLTGSRIITSHVKNDPRVQDPYSLRAAPTVLGAVASTLAWVTSCIEAELGAVTDNPLVFASAKPTIVSGANFHGMPLAIPLDALAIALSHIAGIAERRIYLMTGAFEPESHLKPFLAVQPGLQSGLMIAQYTAAACVNEMIGLATPASVANVSTSAGMEDYNSFGPRAASKARRALELCEHVVAIELLCAAQGIETHRPLKSGKLVEQALAAIRKVVPTLDDDRPLTSDIEAIVRQIRNGLGR